MQINALYSPNQKKKTILETVKIAAEDGYFFLTLDFVSIGPIWKLKLLDWGKAILGASGSSLEQCPRSREVVLSGTSYL